MTFLRRLFSFDNGHRTATTAVLCLLGLCMVLAMAAPRKKRPRKKTDEKIYLIHSDELKYDMYGNNPQAQIVKGRVHFTHKGGHLWCDSAYFFQESNSVQAFGHVRFKQGDTLSMTCRYADYEGSDQMMHARYNVVLKHRRQTLFTDSLDYDRLYSTAYFFEGGRLIDGRDRLVADWGEYNTGTRKAAFYYNVKMRGPDQTITTDTLFYDTKSSTAHVTGPSEIVTKDKNVIHTSDAFLDSRTDQSKLFGRSTIVNGQKTITGDSLYHNSKTKINRGYGNVVYVDKENKNSLICDEMFYNENKGYGYATKNALLKDFSQKDTLYVHADSLKLFTFNINTDSVFRKVHAYYKVRAFRTDVQAVCDSLVFNSKDSCLTMYHDPIVWSDNRQLLGEVIKAYMNDSTIRKAEIINQALSVEKADNENHFDQISSTRMDAYFIDGAIRRTVATGNVKSIYYFAGGKDSTLTNHNYLETDTMKMYISKERQLERIWASKSVGTQYPITQIPPERLKLPEFAWFEQIRPIDKDDIFKWRGKGKGNELKNIPRREAPLQYLGNDKPKEETK